MEEQLAQRDAKKRLEKALKLQEEQGDLLDMAAELRASVEVVISTQHAKLNTASLNFTQHKNACVRATPDGQIHNSST